MTVGKAVLARELEQDIDDLIAWEREALGPKGPVFGATGTPMRRVGEALRAAVENETDEAREELKAALLENRAHNLANPFR